MAANIAMLIFTLVGIGGGLAILRWPRKVAQFFHHAAEPLYSAAKRDKIYTESGAKAAGVGFVPFGGLSLCILIWRLLNGFGLA
ncbi:hypothetical protein [Microbacterium flavescens]|uniref:hypothetical protein n=1 Tax=Microbacterium flavescens TaxID=69366 RepID=UPI001BDE2FC6|nr:hypothetical protein [Microbacterium flavescens]BFF09233.1 hypothetical protein GCM10025699_05360 [Microbacterium flavescens]